MRLLGRMLIVIPLLVGSACTRNIVKTTLYPGPLASPPTNAKGTLSYYLPKNLLKLTISRTAVNLEALEQAAQQAEEQEKITAKKAKEAEVAAKYAEAAAANTPDESRAAAKEKAGLLRGEANLASKLAAAAAKNPGAARAAANAAAAAPEKNTYKDDLSIAVLPLTADTKQLYVAQLNHRVTNDDDLKITTDENGLLETLDMTSSDRTPQIAQDVAKIAIAAAKVATGFGLTAVQPRVTPETAGVQPPCPPIPYIGKKPFVYEYTFDPFDPQKKTVNETAVAEINCALSELDTRFRLAITIVGGKAGEVDASQLLEERGLMEQFWQKEPQYIAGLVYRRPIAYQLTLLEIVSRCEAGKEVNCPAGAALFKTKSAVEMLPNGGPLVVVPLDAGRFVQTGHNVRFKKGLLTENKVVRPSEAVGFVSIPLNILERLVSVPTELLQLKLDFTNKDTDLLQAQKNNIEAQEALRRALDTRKGLTAEPPAEEVR